MAIAPQRRLCHPWSSTGQPAVLTLPHTLIFQLCLTLLFPSGSYSSLKNKEIPGKHALGLFFGVFSHHREKQEVQGVGQHFLFPFPPILFSPTLIFCVPAALGDLPSLGEGHVTGRCPENTARHKICNGRALAHHCPLPLLTRNSCGSWRKKKSVLQVEEDDLSPCQSSEWILPGVFQGV